MTTKDYVYLGLILLTALAFYCNGFYAGVYRCKRMYDSLLGDSESAHNAADTSVEDAHPVAEQEKVMAFHSLDREPKINLTSRELRGNFGNN